MREFAPKPLPLEQEEEEDEDEEAETPIIDDKIIPLSPEQQKLVEDGREQVNIIAKIMFYKIRTPKSSFEFNDVVGWGIIGLIDAAQKFDPKIGIKFSTYAKYRIKGAIIDSLREFNSQNLTSRGHIKFIKYHGEVIRSLEEQLGRKPTTEEIAEKMNLTLDKYFEKLNKYPLEVGVTNLSSLEDKDSQRGKVNSFLDRIQERNRFNGHHKDSKESIELELLDKFLHQIRLEEKNERNRRIVDIYFTAEFTQKEIGEMFGLGYARVSQIINKAMKKLKKLFEKEGYEVSHKNT